jgi:hypothetical protein
VITLLDLSEEKQKDIIKWLSTEIDSALIDRSDLEKKWILWNTNFEAKPKQEVKNFPFERASNLVAPVQSTIVNALIARHLNTLFNQPPFWTAKALNPKFTDHEIPNQRLLDYAQQFELKLKFNSISFLLDYANYGTAFAKIPWIRESRQNKTYDDEGKIIAYEQEIADGPRFIPIPISDFIFPISSTQNIQECQWVAHRFRLRWATIKRRGMGKPPIYINTDKVENFYTREADEITDAKERLEHIWRSTETREYELFEVWCEYDYDGDGHEESCVFTFCKDAGVLLRPILHPFNHHLRPFISSQCFPRAHRVYGIGVGQKLERLQEGMSTIINQAIDNGSLANAPGFKARRGKGIKPGMKWWPGKVTLVDEMDDLQLLEFSGRGLPAAQMVAGFIREFAERDTAVSDYSMGRESSSVGSAATATSTLALIQEGTKIFDFLLGTLREAYNEIGYQTYALYSQFKPSGFIFPTFGERDATLIEESWNNPQYVDIRKAMMFKVTASHPYVNEALERETWVQLFNLILGYYAKVFEASEIIFNPQAPPPLKLLAGKMIGSGQMIIDRIVQHWNILDSDRILLNQEDLASLGIQSNVRGGGGRAVEPGAEEVLR